LSSKRKLKHLILMWVGDCGEGSFIMKISSVDFSFIPSFTTAFFKGGTIIIQAKGEAEEHWKRRL
jgi:hypothetical protein